MIVVEMAIHDQKPKEAGSSLSRRYDLMLAILSVAPALLFVVVLNDSSLNLTIFWYLTTGVTLIATLLVVKGLRGIAGWLKYLSSISSALGILFLLLLFGLPSSTGVPFIIGAAYLLTFILVAVLNVGYFVYRRVKRIP